MKGTSHEVLSLVFIRVHPRYQRFILYFVLAEQLGVAPERITLDTVFTEELGADSLDTIELVMELEEELDLEIPSEDARQMRTLGDLLRWLKERSGPDDS